MKYRSHHNRAGLFINLIPAFASLLSVWLLGESIQVYHLGGIGLVAGGMFLFYYPKTMNGSFISGHAKSATAALILPKRIKA